MTSLLGHEIWGNQQHTGRALPGVFQATTSELPGKSTMNRCMDPIGNTVNYSDLTRPISPKWWFSKGNPLISQVGEIL